jgi:hypothetical protein
VPAKITLPSIGLTNAAFRYRSAAQTDIRKTFARMKREHQKVEATARSGQQALDLDDSATVLHLPTRGTRSAP